MNRVDFMAQLERLLMDLPISDRQDAIAYYNDYFDEAGSENEASVIQELGNPGKVASIIKADLKEHGNQQAEYTERGYQDPRYEEQRNTPSRRRTDGYQEPKQKSKLPIALIIILLVFTSPIWIGLGGGILGLMLGILGVVFGLLVAAVVGGGAMLFGGVVMIGVGIVQVFITPMIGCLLLGLGFLFAAVGLLGVILFVWLAFKVIPKAFRWFVDFCQRILRKGEGRVE